MVVLLLVVAVVVVEPVLIGWAVVGVQSVGLVGLTFRIGHQDELDDLLDVVLVEAAAAAVAGLSSSSETGRRCRRLNLRKTVQNLLVEWVDRLRCLVFAALGLSLLLKFSF